MSRRWSGPPKMRLHIEVFVEDYEWLSARYTGIPVGVGGACREIIHSRVKALRQREIDQREQKAPQAPSEEMETADAQ